MNRHFQNHILPSINAALRISVVLLGGCTNTPVDTITSDNTSSSSGNPSTIDSGGTDVNSSSIEVTSSNPPICGNGELEGSEECDDGNLNVHDDCLPDCKSARCNDGVLWMGKEECDDGNGLDDSCTADCKMGRCGDGVIWLGEEECDDANLVDTDACSNDCVSPRFIFATFLRFKGDLTQIDNDPYHLDIDEKLTGLLRADAICQAAAEYFGPSNEWRAWLSDSTGSPSTRFDTAFTGYYVLDDGTIVAHGWYDLTDGTDLPTAINIDEHGSPIESSLAAWSNTTSAGDKASNDHCNNWSTAVLGPKGRYGDITAKNSEWTNDMLQNPADCENAFHLYCVQQNGRNP